MGNKVNNIVLDTKWTAEDVSVFMLSMNEKQTKIIFKNHKECNPQNLHELLEETVALYLLNVNVKAIQGAKVEDVSKKLEEYKKKGEIREATEPIEKFILENKMKGDYKAIEMSDYSDVVGTWMQTYKSTMDTL